MIVKLIGFGGECKPEYNTYQDAGADVWTTEEVTIPDGRVGCVGLGWGIELPQGTFAAVWPRSGKTLEGLICQLPPIDSGYRGEIHAMIANLSGKEVTIPKGTKIGQLVVQPYIRVEYQTEEEMAGLEDRGTNWAGSSDKKA